MLVCWGVESPGSPGSAGVAWFKPGARGPGCGLLGTTGVLQDAGNTSANDFGQRRTKAGHFDTIGVDTAKPDIRTVRPGTNSTRGADPGEGVPVDQRREHGTSLSPRCTTLEFIHAGTMNCIRRSKAWLHGCQSREVHGAFCSRWHFEGYGRCSVTTSDPSTTGGSVERRCGALDKVPAVPVGLCPTKDQVPNILACDVMGGIVIQADCRHRLTQVRLQPTHQTNQRAQSRRRSTVRACWRPHGWLQSNQDFG